MNYSKLSKQNKDEIELFKVIKLLWLEKFKIIAITFLTVFIVLFISLLSPNKYNINQKIYKNDYGYLFDYRLFNTLISKTDLSQIFEEDTIYYDSLDIFLRFIDEFNDKEEIINILSKNEYVLNSINNLPDIEKNIALSNFAKLFQILEPNQNNNNWKISISWHDYTEALKILDEILITVSDNVKKNVLIELNEMIKFLDNSNQYNLIILNNEIETIKKIKELEKEASLKYLEEQYKIAESIGLAKPKDNFLKIDFVNSKDILGHEHYKKGTIALEKEISLLEERTKEENIRIESEKYFELIEKTMNFEANNINTSEIINKLIKDFDNIDVNLIAFDKDIYEVNNNKDTKLYGLISLIIGFILGVLFVFIKEANKQNN